MLLKSIFEKANKEKSGTYVAVKLSYESEEKLYNYIKTLDIANPIPQDKYHITLIYSRKELKGFDAEGHYDDPIMITPKAFKVFKTQNDSNALVIEIDSPELVKRNAAITKEFGATSDYDSYKCHITVSYNYNSDKPPEVDLAKKLGQLEVTEEYSEPLNFDYVKEKINKMQKGN